MQQRRPSIAPTPMRRLLPALLLAPGLALAQSLPDLVRDALASDPAIAAAQAQVRAADERLVQARAAFGPSMSAVADVGNNRYTDYLEPELRHFRSNSVGLQLTQPIIHNDLIWAHGSASAQLEQAQAAVDQARQDAQEKFVEACFEVLKARDDVRFLQAQKAATAEQLETAQHSFKTGTAAIPDVREAQAKADTVAAQLVGAQFDLEMRQQVLAELAGHPVPALLGRGLDGVQMPRLEADSVLQWLGDAAAASPQIRQAQRALAVAEAEMQKARSAHGPVVEAKASVTHGMETGSETSFFPRKYQDASISVHLTVPLFSSGATSAHAREAEAGFDKARADLDAARRAVIIAVRQDFTAALSAISETRGLESAVRSNEVALAANRRGYQVGMKINAEVLDAQQKLFEARRDLSKARYDAWLNWIKLNAQAGRLDEQRIAQLDALLVEQPDPIVQLKTSRTRP